MKNELIDINGDEFLPVKSIHHFVLAYDAETNTWSWDGELEADLFAKVGGTILNKEDGKFRFSGKILESTDPVDEDIYTVEEIAFAMIHNAVEWLNEKGE